MRRHFYIQVVTYQAGHSSYQDVGFEIDYKDRGWHGSSLSSRGNLPSLYELLQELINFFYSSRMALPQKQTSALFT